MPKEDAINPKDGRANAFWFLIEIAIYSAFVLAYYFLVLHFLGGGLKDLFDTHKTAYAIVALTLMVVQGLGLELLTGWLFKFIRHKAK